MKITKTGNWLFEAHKVLMKLQKSDDANKNKYFSFFITKNMNNFKLEIENFKPLFESSQPSEGYKKYEEEKIQVLEKFAKKDSYGRFRTTNDPVTGEANVLVNKEDLAEFQAADMALIEKYNEDLKQYEVQINELNDILSKELELEVFKISFNMIPDSVDISEIRDLVVETDEEIEKIIMDKTPS